MKKLPAELLLYCYLKRNESKVSHPMFRRMCLLFRGVTGVRSYLSTSEKVWQLCLIHYLFSVYWKNVSKIFSISKRIRKFINK